MADADASPSEKTMPASPDHEDGPVPVTTSTPNNHMTLEQVHQMHKPKPSAMIVVSNRLPFVLKRDEDGILHRKAR